MTLAQELCPITVSSGPATHSVAVKRKSSASCCSPLPGIPPPLVKKKKKKRKKAPAATAGGGEAAGRSQAPPPPPKPYTADLILVSKSGRPVRREGPKWDPSRLTEDTL